MSLSYPDVNLFINGQWRPGNSKKWSNVINPATEDIAGKFAVADTSDLDEALEAADTAFKSWPSNASSTANKP